MPSQQRKTAAPSDKAGEKLAELLRMAYYHLSNPQAHIFDRQREKTALDAQGKNLLKKKKINKLWHIKSAGTLTVLIKVGNKM